MFPGGGAEGEIVLNVEVGAAPGLGFEAWSAARSGREDEGMGGGVPVPCERICDVGLCGIMGACSVA